MYQAHDTMMNREVAIKVLPPDLAADPAFNERFRREANVVARLNNPNILPVFEAGDIDGRLYLVMPVVDGVDLDSLLERDGRMSPTLAVRVIEQAAAGGVAPAAHLGRADVKAPDTPRI